MALKDVPILEGASFLLFRKKPQFAILCPMRLAIIASLIVSCLALNAQTFQGKVVRVSDGDTITILDEESEVSSIVERPKSNSALGV